jgi:hypothetical protein
MYICTYVRSTVVLVVLSMKMGMLSFLGFISIPNTEEAANTAHLVKLEGATVLEMETGDLAIK